MPNFPGEFLRFEITSDCSLRCEHCYLGNNTWDLKDMSLKEIKDILDQLTEYLPLKILFLGGEPFERDEFMNILSETKKRGFKVGIDTSGRFLTAEKIEEMNELGVEKLNLSMYGLSSDVNDQFTYQGHFEQIKTSLKVCKNLEIDVDIAFLLTSQNFHEIFRFGNFLKKYNVEDIHLDVYMALNSSQINSKFELSFGQFLVFWFFIRFYNLYPSAYSKKNNLINIILKKASTKVSPCEQGRAPTIKPNGDVWPCMFYGEIAGNLTEEDPNEVWERINSFQFDSEKCAKCIRSKLPRKLRAISRNDAVEKLMVGLHKGYSKIVEAMY